MTMLGWEVSLLQILRFFLSSPLLYTIQSGLLRSAASSHDTSATGGTRELVSVGKGNRTPLPFPLLRRPSAQRLLLFQHGSLDQALLESFSESRGNRGIDRIGALPVQPAGIRTPREAGGKAQGAARSEAPAHPTVAPPSRLVWVAALHLVGPVSHAIEEGMSVCAGEGEVQDQDSGG